MHRVYQLKSAERAPLELEDPMT